MSFGTSILEGFRKGFGRVLEPKILDFRIFFVIFSMQILECKLEGQKIEKKVAKNVFGLNFGAALRYVRSWGEGL